MRGRKQMPLKVVPQDLSTDRRESIRFPVCDFSGSKSRKAH
jgi:hypothetical protein